MSFADQARRTLDILALTPGWQALKTLRSDCDDETVAAILEEAAFFAEGVLAPLNTVGDRIGASVVDGRVRTPDGFADAFRRYGEAGWLGMDVADHLGGQALPLTLHAACAPLFERACVALMMAAGSTRAAAHLLTEAADEAVAGEWVPKLASGEWAATICISEPDAGSDVGRLRTRAKRQSDQWLVCGQKIWISFGDHDMAGRIGHCLLARTDDAPGTRGISLFLVPNHIDGVANGITLERIEGKMGLHGSPTCALRFENARGILIGQEGRGLPQLFTMIELMRLLTGCQGLGLASAAIDIAEAYAADRKQGGRPDQPPVPINSHPDVKRQLWEMRVATEVVRAAVLEIATAMDLAKLKQDEELKHFIGWMLPLIKNFGADLGFTVASGAMQVLGGAGYTRDWPLEQYLRDARIMTIYEGTTGMQALDLLTRRLWRDDGKGLSVFLKRARAEVASAGEDKAAQDVLALLGEFEQLSGRMKAMQSDADAALWRADAYMRAVWAAASAWMALRLGLREAVPFYTAQFTYQSLRCR
ncbi:acyl-CoA dehydrogenase family protein [Rhizobium sp. NTR19]|uniref:Acyl-CoA dehydrogenase family protein n=1 Tax=Neorhizobium turbinariae TaxID=2937795 RepID=A0ABT0IVM0_9HYPH|nr:acyl-CoA dehydrogenase family protein [Neorhizobium turbinariae]MCK8781932.1 acyl-CoA dehydrogenase family protein [Neorhizobium turbinariae]